MYERDRYIIYSTVNCGFVARTAAGREDNGRKKSFCLFAAHRMAAGKYVIDLHANFVCFFIYLFFVHSFVVILFFNTSRAQNYIINISIIYISTLHLANDDDDDGERKKV